MATRRTRTVKDIPVTSEISAMIAAISKQYGENTIVKGSDILQPWRIPTGIFTFDYATLGGIPHNRVTVFDGAKHSGKTTGALRAVAGAQQSMPDHQAVFVDIEGTFDATYAEKLGVDTDALLVVQPDTGEHAVDIMTGLIHTKEVSLVVGDSLAALLPIKESEASAEDTLVGQQSRLIATMMRKTTAALIKERKRQHYVTLLFINQQRSKIGARSPIPGGEVLSNPGGKAVGFFSTLECTWKNKENIKSNGNGEETLYTNDHAFHIKKNKLHAGMRQGEFQVMRRPDEDLGLEEGHVDDAGTMITFAKRLGWYTGGGRAGYTLTFGEHSYHEPNADAMCRYLYQDRDAYWALRQHLIADSAERMGMKPEFVAYLRGE